METNLLDQSLTSDRYNLRERLLARLLATSLDRQLAAGQLLLPGRALARHASQITTPAARADLAARWYKVLNLAGRPAVSLAPRAPLRRRDVAESEADIRQLIAILASERPIAARGAAAASWLLTDGTGPLYNGHAPIALADAIRAAIRDLDPAAGPSARTHRDSREYCQ
jgi:hypothetical protein